MGTSRPVARLRHDRVILGSMVGCAALYAAFIWRPSFVYRGQRWFTLFDDAMISMTYGRNLAEGHGLVWNAGGEAVQGYTNPLWTVVMAALHRIGVGDPTVALLVSVTSAVLLLGCMALAAAIARELRPPSTLAPRAAALLVGLFYPLVYWSLRGMEVGLATFCTLGAVLLALRLQRAEPGPRPAEVGLLCGVVAAGLLTRDDFVVPAGVVGLWLLIELRGTNRLRVAVPLVVTGAVAVGGQVLARLAYYGDPLPNTYYLKVSGQPLGPRWQRGIATLLAAVLGDGVVVLGVVGAATRRRARPLLLVAVAVALAAYSIYVGGDAWEWARVANRYVTPAAALLLILAAAGAEPLVERIRCSDRARFWVALVVVPAVAMALVDGFLAVAAEGLLGEYRPLTPTTTEVAIVVTLVVAGVLATLYVRGRGSLPSALTDGRALAVVLVVAVGLATTGSAWWRWTDDGGFFTAQNQGSTAYGLELGRVVRPGGTIAVVWAGAPIYAARRAGVDLLGKMDPVIARGPHHPGFRMYPGHDKFDLAHSIGKLRPDAVAQFIWFKESDVDDLVAWGYEPMRFRPGVADELQALAVPRALLWIRRDSTLIDRDLLEPVPLDEARRRTVEWS